MHHDQGWAAPVPLVEDVGPILRCDCALSHVRQSPWFSEYCITARCSFGHQVLKEILSSGVVWSDPIELQIDALASSQVRSWLALIPPKLLLFPVICWFVMR